MWAVRFCIDYRMVNAIKDVYPLPQIDETLENMYGAQRFTSLALHAGYWQVPVELKDRDKTGFGIRKGLFWFVRMPLGLAKAPGTFQRMMTAVLRGLMWQCCLVYLDDVIIFTKGGVARHELDENGIRPMESLVRSVREFPVPQNDKAANDLSISRDSIGIKSKI
ncbi:unnamed protein product [Phytophthora fragariaefolia]|uniref:Unnamed protein product n=1 Tax=Phytophthora fragariaefolia TaxID=1490495 RepID=A0A9W6YCS0_9STRA|nr:unnamed protein product [Phytophthora fragariaefolia]